MEIHDAATAFEVAARLSQQWSGPRADPFGFDLAVVPGPGWQRWLSQQLATGAGGICAGIEFTSLGTLQARLVGADDPWRPRRLAWLIQQLIAEHDSDPPWAVLVSHLKAAHESFSVTARIAAQFGGYADFAPEMLQRWAEGSNVGPTGEPLTDHAWQPMLWRALVQQTGVDPVQRHRRALDDLRRRAHPEIPHRVSIIAPARLDASMLELFDALGSHHQVELLMLASAPARRAQLGTDSRRSQLIRPDGHPLNQALGALGDENAALLPAQSPALPQHPDNLLGWLATDLLLDQPPTPRRWDPTDRSVQLHLSHGPSRQVEVLREVLADLYLHDRSLEPRHIAVITPDPEGFGPLLDAAFSASTPDQAHPASGFRLHLADQTQTEVNPLVGLLTHLLSLPDSRAEASVVLQLCAEPAIARRFGFTAEAHQRLSDLVSSAGIRWGLSPAQRAEFGLGGLPQNTWQAGLQRLLLGVALSEQDLITVGTVLPMDDVDSSDVELIGGITEFIGRLSRWLQQLKQPAPLAEWVQRCRDILADLIELPPASEWLSADLLTGLAQLAEDGPSGDVAAPISRRSALAAIEGHFRQAPARAGFGNGSTVVAGLTSLDRVPHRVVVLLGWDAERYPRPDQHHGDDLLRLDPPVGAPSTAMADRQALLNAIQAAQQSLVIICRGRSEATNAEVPLATPLAELMDTLNATAQTPTGEPVTGVISRQHPLQPFAPDYFRPDSDLPSVDPLAYRAALSWQQAAAGRVEERNRYRLDPLPPPDLSGGVTLQQLLDFYRHPARTLLKVRAGLSLADEKLPDDQIPIEPDALERWQIGSRLLDQLRAGADPESVERAEWLRGQVPPLQLGHKVMSTAMTDALRTAADAPAAVAGRHHDVAVSIPGPDGLPVTVSGRVLSHGHTVWQVEFSSLQPRQKLSAWISLLVLAAAEPDSWDAMVVGRGRRTRLLAPPAAAATELLTRYLRLYSLGLSRPLPAMPRLNAEWANHRASARDPRSGYAAKGLRRTWDWESDLYWNRFFTYPELLELPAEDGAIPGADPTETTLVGALASSIWGPLLHAEVAP